MNEYLVCFTVALNQNKKITITKINYWEIKFNDKDQVMTKWFGLGGGYLSLHSSFVCLYYSLLQWKKK